MSILRKTFPLLFLAFVASVAPAATWTTIDVPGAVQTQCVGINSAGDIVGIYVDPADVTHGFVLKAGVFTTLDVPGAVSTWPNGINDAGQISGWFRSTQGQEHGFFFDGQNFTTLDVPDSLFTYALKIDNAGEVVGWYADANNIGHGFKWSTGNYTTIDKPGSGHSELHGINNRGDMVGDTNRGFLLNRHGIFRTFDFPGFSVDINDHKVIVGFYSKRTNHGFRFSAKRKVFTKLDYPGSRATICFGINFAGEIIGYYDNGGVIHGFVRTL